MSAGSPLWLESEELQRLDAAIEADQTSEIDQLLAALLARHGDNHTKPSLCAVCQHDVVRGELLQVGAVWTCPRGHGGWLDPEGLPALHRLAGRHLRARRRRARVRRGLLVAALAAAIWAAVLTGAPGDFYAAALDPPMSADERRYLSQLMTVLDDGISNRLGVDGVLKSPSEPGTYLHVYAMYRQRQEDILNRLQGLRVPPRLRDIHHRIVTATEHQIFFYRAFADARERGEAVDLARRHGQPDLHTSDRALRTAWDSMRQAFPSLDARLAFALESRLCRFDPK